MGQPWSDRAGFCWSIVAGAAGEPVLCRAGFCSLKVCWSVRLFLIARAILSGGSRLPAEVVSAHPGLLLRVEILHGLGNRDDRAAVGGSPSGWTKNAR